MNSQLSLAATLVFMTAGVACAAESGTTVVYDAPLRVCADPDNLPYSNRDGNGFENKLAQLAAAYLGTRVDYTWFAERGNFLKATLEAGECDVVMGYPAEAGLLSTRSYYRSSYVFVSRADRNLTVESIEDPALRSLRIGIHLVGGQAAAAPAIALGREGIVDSVVGFPVYGASVGAFPARAGPVVAVERGDIDIAAIWGPIGGYFAKLSSVPLRVVPIADTARFIPAVFNYPISMALRLDEADLRDRLNGFIASHKAEIDELLRSYGVPTL